MSIQTIKIHPAIGIARVGDSPTGFFVGPESPGVSVPPAGGYRDGKHRIKRQAARFRLFGYDADGKLVREITPSDGLIQWTVHLANAKAAWMQFDGLNAGTPLRNGDIRDRTTLVIDPGPRTIAGPKKSASFDTGKFLGASVPLGGIRSDEKARLLVLGGFGKSGSPANAPLTTYANNDGWHDDVSDGPVTAVVKLKDRRTLNAVPAWVIVGPPKYAPGIDHVITLYDTLLQVAVDRLGYIVPARPSFTRHIYPLFQRAINARWVSHMVSHPEAHAGEELEREGPAHQTLEEAIPPPATDEARGKVFDKLRDPALGPSESSGEADMPMLHSEFYPLEVNQTLTRVQYEMMRQWKDGNFIQDWAGPPIPDKTITPEGLDRAGLESCVGGPFYPGIEAGWMLRDTYAYSEPFRLNQANLRPGDVTKQMAVPWQADFSDCTQEGELAWWPAQRPDDVFPERGGDQVPWVRDIAETPEDMVKNWRKLGFVVRKGGKFVETERRP